MKKVDNKEMRKLMQTVGTKFNVEGFKWSGKEAVFTVGDGYISMGFDSMNISYIGNTKVDLYTYDMLGTKTKGTILFKDITIIE